MKPEVVRLRDVVRDPFVSGRAAPDQNLSALYLQPRVNTRCRFPLTIWPWSVSFLALWFAEDACIFQLATEPHDRLLVVGHLDVECHLFEMLDLAGDSIE